MKNWKSSLVGMLLAVGDVLTQFLSDPHFDWSRPQNYLRPILLAALGFVVADARKTAQLIALFLICNGLTGCVTSETTVTAPDGTITHTKTSGPDAASVNAASAAVAIAGQFVAPRIIAEK